MKNARYQLPINDKFQRLSFQDKGKNKLTEAQRNQLKTVMQNMKPQMDAAFKDSWAQQDQLFGQTVDLENPNTLRNFSELIATKTIIETFKKAINALTIQKKGDAEIRDTIKLRQTRPFVTKDQGYLIPKKSVFNRIIGDSHLELLFARFLEDCTDVVSYAKNYLAIHFKLDYINADGDISNYYPDFIVRLLDKRIVIVETKGLEDLDVPLKMVRLKQWCEDINRVQEKIRYDFVYVDQTSFEKFKPDSFKKLLDGFKEYKESS